ncbi:MULTISPECIES: hypothetical protein [unclassified Streptomyces]|uniref:hypothetical protein n=1 Tax=unclassified Streptomyces TaxID=2593676 RepID=UPI0004C01F3C|nr:MULTISPECIES: hypothetical protein [unclassified Streptomyces]
MAGNGRSKAYLCGQLYATLSVLRVISTGSNELAQTARLDKASGSPRVELRKHLQQAGEHLEDAMKDARRAQAAAEVFQAIPGFIPPGGVPSNRFAPKESEDFSDGYSDQLVAYKRKFSSLLG